MLDSLDHLVLAVDDLARAEGVLTRLLGRRASWRGEHPGQGTANVLFRLEKTYVELLAPVGPGGTADLLRQRLDAQGEGLVGLAFGTPDADATLAEWRDRDLDPAGPVDGLGRDSESGAFRQWRHVLLPFEKSRGPLLFAIEHQSPPDILPMAPAAGDGSDAVAGVDHVVVQTGDAEACKSLYGDGLGLRLALDRSFEQWGARLLFFRVGGITVEVAAQLGGDAGRDAPDPARDELWGISWQVRDADAARGRLAGSGVDVSEVRDGRKPGTRVFTIRGEPCGVAMLAIQPAS